jgi:hypothetical protein
MAFLATCAEAYAKTRDLSNSKSFELKGQKGMED